MCRSSCRPPVAGERVSTYASSVKQRRQRVRVFQRTGMDLGVLRDRLVRGVAGPAELARERDLIATMRDLRGKVMLPGVAESPVDERSTTSSSW